MTDRSNTTPGKGETRTLKVALALAEAGYLVFPCRPFSKAPATENGFKDASIDPDQIRAWFDNDRGLNLAVRCGPQPNGVNLLAVDIDPKNGGLETWRALTDTHGVPLSPRHETPSGGFHLFFDIPAGCGRTGPHVLGAGVDTRGDGGYVVVPPSRLYDDDGEIITYRTSATTALGANRPYGCPLWLIELLAEPEPLTMSQRRHPSQQPVLSLGDSVADLAREGWDWHAELEADGWVCVRAAGTDTQWTRPGKNPRDGTSATLHPGGPLVVWSTSVPVGGVPTTDHVGRSYSPWDYIVTFRAGGDTKVAAALVRGVAPQRAVTEPPSIEATATLNLPTGFWNQRPHLEHVLIAAQAASCSPDALLVHALTRTATFIHPCFKLPGVEQGLIGKHQTLDFLGCVIAETSGGKTMAAGVGEMLIPAPDPPTTGEPAIDFEQKVGSGEGIAEFFLVPEVRTDDEGKEYTTNRRVIGKQALFMNVDEGTGFTNQAGRKGATIVATLASAWSGESLGQLNASDETRRLVQGGRVRICAVINMQDTNGYKLFTDDLESVGFTGRLLFASAHDPSAPAPGTEPEWPGPLKWNIRSSAGRNVYFTYDEAIRSEIKGMRHGILTKQVQIDRRQSQYLLLRCKVAAILAVWDDRTSISLEDWSIATDIVSMSATCLDHLSGTHSVQMESTAVTAAAFKMRVSEKAESMHVRHLKIGWSAKLVERLRKRGPLPWKGLKDIVENDRRPELRACLEAMIDEGIVEHDGTHYKLA